jgi:hypothetical protein
MLMATEPDLILIPGDIIHADHLDYFRDYTEKIPSFRDLLSELHAPGGVFFVQGNTDIPQLEEQLFEGTDVVALRFETTQIEIKGRTITLAGLPLSGYRNPAGLALIASLEENPLEGDIRILMSHKPDSILVLPTNSRIDLVIAGHTHGGQVQIPFFGPPITLSNVSRKIAAGGLNEHNGNLIYVSRGIGVERQQAPRVRFFAPPEISLLTLE